MLILQSLALFLSFIQQRKKEKSLLQIDISKLSVFNIYV